VRYQPQPIDAGSITYVVEQLESGQGLAHLLLRSDLRAGRVQACLPSDEPLTAADFSNGSLRDDQQEAEALRTLTGHLINSCGLTRDPTLLLLGQFPDGAKQRGLRDAIANEDRDRYSTAWLKDADPPYYNGELWYADRSSTFAAIETLLRDLLWFPAIAVLVQAPDGRRLTNDSKISFESLSVLVERPRAILIGAWDAMNYLLWTPVTGRASNEIDTGAA
jgi:hypothetical protein